MRLVEFLILLLQAQAETLKRLAAFFGEEEFVEMLETSENPEIERQIPRELDLSRVPFSAMNDRLPAGARSPYVELEGAVRELGLPATLEFHLWAYPYYRRFIESDLDLGSVCAGSDDASTAPITALIEEAIEQARQWVHRLTIPPSVAGAAETAAEVPWIRFRVQALKKLGLRPMEPLRPSR